MCKHIIISYPLLVREILVDFIVVGDDETIG